MPAIPALSPPLGAPQNGRADALKDVDLDRFLDLMLAELQNQDPLNPVDNSEFLQQISQIRQIGSTDRLTDTLDAVLASQQLSSAGALLGRTIDGLADDGANVQGVVERVSVVPEGDGAARKIRLQVGGQSVALQNVREVRED